MGLCKQLLSRPDVQICAFIVLLLFHLAFSFHIDPRIGEGSGVLVLEVSLSLFPFPFLFLSLLAVLFTVCVIDWYYPLFFLNVGT